RHRGGTEGDHGRAVALPRLHQPVPDAAPPVRSEPQLTESSRGISSGRGSTAPLLVSEARDKMEGVVTRGAVPADAPAITAIYAESVSQSTASFEIVPPDEAEMARRMAALAEKGYPYFVAEREGRIIGYGYAG